MGVSHTPKLDGHDVDPQDRCHHRRQDRGKRPQIGGFFYAADFPDAVSRIRANRAAMGFSFDAQRIAVEDTEADPLVITACVFTGAAVLQKDRGAYLETSLAAQAAGTGRNKAMETLTGTVALDPFTMHVLRLNRVDVPLFDTKRGLLNVQAASDTTFDAFSKMLREKIPDPRQRLQVKIAVERLLANRGINLVV